MAFYRDQVLLDEYSRTGTEKNDTRASTYFTLDTQDWVRDSDGNCDFIPRKITLPLLKQLDSPSLRIIFAPLDNESGGFRKSFLELYSHYNVPSAFLAGRMRSVTHSFGALDNINGYNCAWFHYLCKNVNVTGSSQKPAITEPNLRQGVPVLDQSDSSWMRSGYFLRWAVDSTTNPEVTLICFDSSFYLKERFQQIPPSEIPRTAILDPYSLFVIILEELSLQMDNIVWDVTSVVRGVELNTLMIAKKNDSSTNMDSLTGIHNVSKQLTFLQESSEAAMYTLKSMMSHHHCDSVTLATASQQASKLAHSMLEHIETQFQCINLRLKSLDKRMVNILTLSFHLVTQDNNRIMQMESSSMSSIALVTLVFLPMSTVSTVFGSQFFNYDHSLIHVSRSFWIFWLVSIPLTVVVLVIWHISVFELPFARTFGRLKHMKVGN